MTSPIVVITQPPPNTFLQLQQLFTINCIQLWLIFWFHLDKLHDTPQELHIQYKHPRGYWERRKFAAKLKPERLRIHVVELHRFKMSNLAEGWSYHFTLTYNLVIYARAKSYTLSHLTRRSGCFFYARNTVVTSNTWLRPIAGEAKNVYHGRLLSSGNYRFLFTLH